MWIEFRQTGRFKRLQIHGTLLDIESFVQLLNSAEYDVPSIHNAGDLVIEVVKHYGDGQLSIPGEDDIEGL